MGALLIPNKPIYRKTEGEEYYIYFSKETVLKASQRYLTNGYQGNSTLEHSDNLEGLTLVESWIVEDEVQDKSRKYGLNAPVGTWMGTIKVNNDEVWNDYVKTGKVKGFSIEGFFADKIEASKMNKKMNENKEADLLLSKITSIVKGERVELGLIDDLKNLQKQSTSVYTDYIDDMDASKGFMSKAIDKSAKAAKMLKEQIKLYNNIESTYKELGIDMPSELKKVTPIPALQITEKDLSMMQSLYKQFKVK